MSEPAEPGEGADDLFGRWLAHREKPSEDGEAPRPRRVPTPARPSTPSAPAEAKQPTVDKHDGLGPVTLPSSFGVKRGLPGSAHSGPTGAPRRPVPGETAELDRPSPVGFEPVILRSVRKKSEPKDESEKDKRGRLSRLRSRVAGPLDDDGSDAQLDTQQPVGADEQVAVPPPPVFPTTPASAAPEPEAEAEPEVKPKAKTKAKSKPQQKRKIVAYDDMIALATMAALPVTEPEAIAEPEPEPVVEPEPVLAGPELETPPSPHPVLPERQDDEVPPMSSAVVDPSTPPANRRRLVARPKGRPEDEPKRRPPVARGTGEPSTADAARGMLAAARAATPATRTPRPATPVVETATMLPAPAVVEPEVPVAPPMEMPTVYEFAQLKTSRRFLTLMLLGGLILSGYLGYHAYLSRDTVEIGIAAVVVFATLVIWGIRAGASVARLTVRSGQLEIVRQGGRQVFDLTSRYTPIEVIGKPGSKKWKVLFLRRGMSPAVVDATMVDGKDFMRVLGFFRPELQLVKK